MHTAFRVIQCSARWHGLRGCCAVLVVVGSVSVAWAQPSLPLVDEVESTTEQEPVEPSLHARKPPPEPKPDVKKPEVHPGGNGRSRRSVRVRATVTLLDPSADLGDVVSKIRRRRAEQARAQRELGTRDVNGSMRSARERARAIPVKRKAEMREAKRRAATAARRQARVDQRRERRARRVAARRAAGSLRR